MPESPYPPCGDCGGAHHWDLTHRHDHTCPRYRPETATTVADYDRRRGVRPATLTEEKIINEHRYAQPRDGERYYVEFSHSGVHCREVLIGTDPDTARPAHRAGDDDGGGPAAA